jgi:hypothetical protein
MRCEVVPLRVQEAARSGGDKLPKITFVTIARRTTIDQIVQLIAPASTMWSEVIYFQFTADLRFADAAIPATIMVGASHEGACFLIYCHPISYEVSAR